MPKFKTGDIWTSLEDTDWLVITTNTYIKKDGTLVMGAGIAKQASDKYPIIKKIFGDDITSSCGHLGKYHILYWKKIIALQTKVHYIDPSSIELIQESINRLQIFVNKHPNRSIVNMVFPGVGYGGLSQHKVYEYCLKDLPDNYIVWTKDNP